MERRARWLVQQAFVSVLLLPPTSIVYACIQEGPCKCTSDQGTIDLTQIPGSPSFADILDGQNKWLFSYSPCNAFTEGQGCQNVAVCQVSQDRVESYPAGTVESATWGVDGSTGMDTITYTQTSEQITRTTIVKLQCDPGASFDTLTVAGEGLPSTYDMTLSGPHCCYQTGPTAPPPSGGPSKSSSGGGLSIGSVLCIILVCLVVVYITAGIAIQKGVRKASGREVFPNYPLWAALPGTIAEGVRFTFRGCKGRSTYDRV